MAEVMQLDRVVQIGMEAAATPGTIVAATKQLQTIRLLPSIKLNAPTFVPQGQKYVTVAMPSKEWTEAPITGDPSYGELPYLLTGLFGPATITTPTGGTVSRQWQWTLQGTVLDALRTFTVETGDAVRAERFGYGTIPDLGLKFSREAIGLTGKMIGQQTLDAAVLTPLTPVNAVQTITIGGTAPTGGTFTLSYQGQTTAPIAWNATASALIAALTALSTIGSGNVSGSGGPLPGSGIAVTFQGNLGNQPVAAITGNATALTGGTGNTIAVAQTTAGVAITPEPQAQIVVPNQVNLFIDSSSGLIGNTQYLRDFDIDWQLTGKYEPFWTMNASNASFAGMAEKLPKTQFKATIASDAQQANLLTALRAASTQFVRIQATGPVIEGTITYQFTIDMAIKVKDPGTAKDFEGIYVRDWMGEIAHDYAWNKAMVVTVINKLAAL